MATAASQQQQPQPQQAQDGHHGGNVRLLWNQDNIRDVAESVGISNMSDEAQRTLTQEVEYRVGQVIIESLRFMKGAERTTLTVQDVNAAMRTLDVEPLYGYDSTRPLRYGEASLGPGQPIFYVEDEEVDFEKIINAPLPKIPRDMAMTAHWLSVEGVQPSIPQNPIQSDSRTNDLLPKGPGANPALAALAGNDHVAHRPAVKHVLSKEMTLYFDKIQTAILDDNPDEEVERLRRAALASVRDDPGIHQLVPYFVNFISNQVTHHMEDVFVLKQMMELTAALIANKTLFLDSYAPALSAPALTCLLSRRLGSDDGEGDPERARREQYGLREFSASIIGELARRFSASNELLRSKLTRSCLKYFLDKDKPPAITYGAIKGLLAAGGPETIRHIVLDTLRSVDEAILEPLRQAALSNPASRVEYDMVVGAIVEAVASISSTTSTVALTGGQAGNPPSDADMNALIEYIGPSVAHRVAALRDPGLVKRILERRSAD